MFLLMLNIALALDNEIEQSIDSFVTLSLPINGGLSYGRLAEDSLDPKTSISAIYSEAQGYKEIAALFQDYRVSVSREIKKPEKIDEIKKSVVRDVDAKKKTKAKEEITEDKKPYELTKLEEPKINSQSIFVDGSFLNNFILAYKEDKWLWCKKALKGDSKCKDELKLVSDLKDLEQGSAYYSIINSLNGLGFKYGLENLVNAIATAKLNGKDIDLIIQDKKIELTKDEIIVKKEITSGDSIGGRPVKFEDEEIKESYITIKIGNKEFKKIFKIDDNSIIDKESKNYNLALVELYNLALKDSAENKDGELIFYIKEFVLKKEIGIDPNLVSAIVQVGGDLDKKSIEKAVDYIVEIDAKLKRNKIQANLENVAAAYYAGPEQVIKYKGVPVNAETEEFVNKVRKIYKEMTNE